jgi:hypothetical protein
MFTKLSGSKTVRMLAMRDETLVEAVFKRDRTIVISGIAGVSVLAGHTCSTWPGA